MDNKAYSLGELISFIKKDVTELLNVKLQLLKLEAVEKGSLGASFFVYGIIIVGLVFFMTLFGFIALGFLFAQWVDSLPGGFALVLVLYLIIIGVMIACKKPILNGITNLFIRELYPDLNEGVEGNQAERTREEGCHE